MGRDKKSMSQPAQQQTHQQTQNINHNNHAQQQHQHVTNHHQPHQQQQQQHHASQSSLPHTQLHQNTPVLASGPVATHSNGQTNLTQLPQKSARKSNYPLHHKSSGTSSTYSPPNLHHYKSRFTKSRPNELYDIAPITCKDYVWLLVYYIWLYAFYAIFWYSLWSIYMFTTPIGKPRHPHRAAILGLRNGIIPGNKMITVIDCNGTRRLVGEEALLD